MKQMLKPAPDYFFTSETIMGIDNVERTLSIIDFENANICSECFLMAFCIKCDKCARHICDACSDWIFKKSGRGKKKIRMIDVKCPCRKLLYNDFY